MSFCTWMGSWNSVASTGLLAMAGQCLLSIQAFSLLLCPAPSPPVNKLQARRRVFLEQLTWTDQRDMTTCSAVKAVRKEVGRGCSWLWCLPSWLPRKLLLVCLLMGSREWILTVLIAYLVLSLLNCHYLHLACLLFCLPLQLKRGISKQLGRYSAVSLG